MVFARKERFKAKKIWNAKNDILSFKIRDNRAKNYPK